MQDSSKTKPDAETAGDAVLFLRQEIERLNAALESDKRELLEKEDVLSSLTEELSTLRKGNLLSDKEASLERMTAEMERAQEMATMGSWVLEVESGKVFWTPELHKMFGQDPSCPVPDIEEQKHCYTKASYKTMVAAANRMIQDGKPYNVELEIIRRDGTKGMLRSIGEIEKDESDRIVRLRGVAQDISEIKEAEAKLKYALEQERAAKIYKDQFLANMSHEIRTPLNGVVGFASLLRDEDLDATTRNEYIDTIESCSKQLLNLIDDIIDVAKIEAGEIKIKKQFFNLAELMHEIANTLNTIRQDMNKEHIRLETHIPEGSETLKIYSDPLRIQQILTNLLNNALKFSHKGTIDFGFKLIDESVEFFVRDEGIGIEPERRELIFERFEHFEGTTYKYEGTGLGLSISLGLTQLLGGSLSVESELGEGSTFRLKIPLE